MRRLLPAVAAILLLAGCTTSAPESEVEESTVAPFAIDADFPDPDVLQVDDEYHLYATNGAGFNVQQATSTDLQDWEILGTDALPTLPEWALPGKTWAPEVTQAADGSYLLYFTAASKNPPVQCIGVATSVDPEGPFVSESAAPIVCTPEEGGSIDPSTFRDDDGTLYLLFKNDGNCCGYDTWLQIAPLSEDGLSLTADFTRLVMQDQEWEGNLVEAPTLVERDGTYTLLYSANDYGGQGYAMGYATADSLMGPYTKGKDPLLTTFSSDYRYLGPGGQDVVVAPDGTDMLVFHSWDELYIKRGVNVAPITFTDGVPSVTLPG